MSVIHKSDWMNYSAEDDWWFAEAYVPNSDLGPGPSNPIAAGCGSGVRIAGLDEDADPSGFEAGQCRYWLSFDPFEGGAEDEVTNCLSWGEAVLEAEDQDRQVCVVAEHGVIFWKLEWRPAEKSE